MGKRVQLQLVCSKKLNEDSRPMFEVVMVSLAFEKSFGWESFVAWLAMF